MHPDLVHAASVRLTQHHAGAPVVTQLEEGGGAVLALRRHLAHTNLVADHLNGLRAAHLLAGIITHNIIHHS